MQLIRVDVNVRQAVIIKTVSLELIRETTKKNKFLK